MLLLCSLVCWKLIYIFLSLLLFCVGKLGRFSRKSQDNNDNSAHIPDDLKLYYVLYTTAWRLSNNLMYGVSFRGLYCSSLIFISSDSRKINFLIRFITTIYSLFIHIQPISLEDYDSIILSNYTVNSPIAQVLYLLSFLFLSSHNVVAANGKNVTISSFLYPLLSPTFRVLPHHQQAQPSIGMMEC